MRLVAATSDIQWTRGRQLIRDLNIPHPWTMNRSRHHMYLLETNEGGTFDEVTEEVTGRTLGGVIVATDGFSANECIIAVHPDYRRQRWGYRMLNWMLSTSYEVVYGNINTYDHAAMAFAAHYGQFDGATQHNGILLATARFDYSSPGWQHPGCRCVTCLEDVSSLNFGPRRRR